jgi:acyl-CoA synthetase (AMP-forming)/AMP-acid ligase II
MNLAQLLLRTAQRQPDAMAVLEPGRARHDYATLARRSLGLAGALRERLHLAPGDRVGLVMQNNAAYVELLYSCWAAGLAAIPINVKLHAREVAWVLDDAQATVCFVTPGVDTQVIEAARANGKTRFYDVDTTEYETLTTAAPAQVADLAPDTLAWLFYTSGTTGRPKGVMLSHRNMLAMALNYLADVDYAQAGETLLHAAPMSHGSGIYIVPNIAAGALVRPRSRPFCNRAQA